MKNKQKIKTRKNKGYVVVMVLVFSAVFVVLLSSLSSFILIQNRVQITKESREKAMQIAEAGLDYYRWFLSHYPEDIADGTGNPGQVYEHEYMDPEDGAIGKFALEINGNKVCNELTSIDITSTGWTYDNPNLEREVFGKYSRPSVAEYAYILNSNVWAGADRIIRGKYHSNGGIRMDGDNQSIVSSALETWRCTSSFGCSPSRDEDGVFGDGLNSVLWKFPVEPVDFVGITVDLMNMKTRAETDGLYFAPINSTSERRGYHIIFKNDGTLDAYRVTNASYYWGQNDGIWTRDYHRITRENFLGNYTVPTDCGLIFVEDKLWLEGVIKGKVTIVSADVTIANNNTDIILNGNLTYTSSDGSDGLTAVAEGSVLIPMRSPDNMQVYGIIMAQKGHFGRNYYTYGYPSYGYSYYKRNSLRMHGSIVSDGRVGTRWSCGGTYCSGYSSRENTYDRKLATDPPPMTPFVDDEFKFIEWRED